MNIIITGVGNEIHFLIKSFISKKHSVTVIEESEQQCNYFAKKHPEIDVVLGNPSNPNILKDAGIIFADIIIALTPSDANNLIICQIAKKMFNINKTFAVAHDPQNVEIFKKLGLDTVICHTNLISSVIEQKISIEEIISLVPINDGQLSIFEIKVPSTSPVLDKSLAEIKLPENSVIGCIIRDGLSIIPRGNTKIYSDDKLIVLCLSEAQNNLFSLLTGRRN